MRRAHCNITGDVDAATRPRRHTEHHFGHHPTASRAVLLMGIAASVTKRRINSDIMYSTKHKKRHGTPSFIVPMHPAVDVLSYCVDTELVYSVGFGDSGDSFCDTSTPVVLMSVCGGLRRELALAPV
eukprot:PhM_4_TR9473/c4_g2_i1/m.2163